MSHYVVTGCAGFIGSHLTDRLLADGHSVIGIDSFEDFYPRVLKEANLETARANPAFTLVEADILDLAVERTGSPGDSRLVELIRGSTCLYHLAAQAGVRSSCGSSFEIYTRNNVLATQRLLEASVAAAIARLVYVSSSSVYGNQEKLPLQETMSPRPHSPYGVTKLAAEHLCGLYHANHGLPVVSLRFFTVYGPRQRPDMAFHKFIEALRHDREIEVYGDGLQTRDFTYIDDIVQGLLLAQDAPPGSVLNVGGGTRIALIDAIEALGEVAGIRPQVAYRPGKTGDVRATWADLDRATSLMGYRPTTTVAEGLARQWVSAVDSR